MASPSAFLRLFVLLIVAIAAHGHDKRRPTVEQQIKAQMKINEAVINAAARAYNQTAATKETVAPLYTKDVVWTITSGTDPTLPTLEFVGTDSPTFYKGFKVIYTQAPVTFKVVNVIAMDQKNAVFKFLVFSPKRGHKPFEFVTAYAIKTKENKWVARLMSVSQFRN